jgi:protein TonB
MTAASPDPIFAELRRRARRDRAEWVGSFAVAIAIHVIVAVLLMLDFGSPPPPPSRDAQAQMVVELAEAATAPEAPSSDMPVGPEQQEQEARQMPVEEPPAFDPPPEAKGPPPPDALPLRREVTPPAPAAVKVEQTTAPRAAVADAGETVKAPVEGQSDAAVRAENQSWESRLLAHLHRYKRYPAGARAMRQEDVIYLAFTIDRNGKVLASRLARSRGYAQLDAEVASLIQRASPLPAPPKAMGGDTIQMVVPIEFYLRQSVARR